VKYLIIILCVSFIQPLFLYSDNLLNSNLEKVQSNRDNIKSRSGKIPAGRPAVSSADLSAEDILKKVDENYTSDNRHVTSTMIIKGRRADRTIRAESWIQGMEKAFTEYLYPPREQGTKMLKLGDELWIYSPSTDRTIKIAGHMLRQSLMGSDISYEDYMEDPVLTNIYNAELTGEEIVQERKCYILKLTAKQGQNPAYFLRMLWIDKERCLPLKEELFAKSGKLLKILVIKEVFKVSRRWYPKKMVFKDVLKKGEGTEFIIDFIEFNVDIPEYIFSKASLRK